MTYTSNYFTAVNLNLNMSIMRVQWCLSCLLKPQIQPTEIDHNLFTESKLVQLGCTSGYQHQMSPCRCSEDLAVNSRSFQTCIELLEHHHFPQTQSVISSWPAPCPIELKPTRMLLLAVRANFDHVRGGQV